MQERVVLFGHPAGRDNFKASFLLTGHAGIKSVRGSRSEWVAVAGRSVQSLELVIGYRGRLEFRGMRLHSSFGIGKPGGVVNRLAGPRAAPHQVTIVGDLRIGTACRNGETNEENKRQTYF